MTAYEPRFYRSGMGARWKSFRVVYLETDLWIAVDQDSYHPDMEDYALKRVIICRRLLDKHIESNPAFLKSLIPLPLPSPSPRKILKEMYLSSAKAGTGPMSAVAGAVAEHMYKELCRKFKIKEIVIENGGDIFMRVTAPAVISVYAGTSPLSEKIGIEITPDLSPLSVCCSSGTIGHSLSLGTADACMIACKSGAQADAYATAFCNEVKEKDDVTKATEMAVKKSDILSVIIIKDDKAGVAGKIEMKVLR